MQRRPLSIFIRDLKYGFGWVEVFENYQMLSYAMLAAGKADSPWRINLGIVQPRANHPDGPIRIWEFAADDLRPYANFIRGAMERAALAAPPVATGDHCRYCKGLLNCHTAAAAAGYAMDAAGTAGHGPMTPETFALEMEFVNRASAMLGQRLTAMEAEGIAMIQAGATIPGWEARQAPGAMAWTGTDPVAAGEMLGVDLRQPVKAITPAQAIARKLLTDKMVKALTERTMGAFKLKRQDPTWARKLLAAPAQGGK